ncbi:hypothetical protein T484DRAFT_1937992 [Baffinella frigidus]|nr:hypothetical protein T484DRAFT_1937992 [Cryptophyta sp. CCMP2293]
MLKWLLDFAALGAVVLQASPAAAFSHTPPGGGGSLGGRGKGRFPPVALGVFRRYKVLRAPGLAMAAKPDHSIFRAALKAVEQSGPLVGMLALWAGFGATCFGMISYMLKDKFTIMKNSLVSKNDFDHAFKELNSGVRVQLTELKSELRYELKSELRYGFLGIKSELRYDFLGIMMFGVWPHWMFGVWSHWMRS